MHKYNNKRYTRDYYDDEYDSSSDDDDYTTPLAKDMSKTDRQIAELLYNLNHIDDKPEPKSKISEEVKKKRAANLAKAREVRMKKLKEKKEGGGGGNINASTEEQQPLEEEHSGLAKPKKGIIARGDDDPFANTKPVTSSSSSGLKIPPPDAPMPGDNAVMPVYF